ncbi:MAG: helix-turn-helix transcriptional regulator [Peptostreptococcaceae bacterium]|nr:helix-turn-helix transcriptional regulator [Peptostreptococcaceae bacterium]
MSNYNEFVNDILEKNESLKKNFDLLELKYLLIETLINYRKENDMTQTEFAQKIDVKQQVISRFEKGEVDPRLSFVSKILYGMKKQIILSDEDYRKTYEKLILLKPNNKKAKFNTPKSYQCDLAV